MKPHQINLANAIILILLSAWGYFGSANPSITALIPAAFGLGLLALNPGLKRENKIVAHLVVVLTLLIVIALIMPLKGAIGRGDTMGITRVAIMLVSGIVAIAIFVRSFIEARKARD